MEIGQNQIIVKIETFEVSSDDPLPQKRLILLSFFFFFTIFVIYMGTSPRIF